MPFIPAENFNSNIKLEHRYKEIVKLKKRREELAKHLDELKSELSDADSERNRVCLNILIKNKETEIYDVDFNIQKNRKIFDELYNEFGKNTMVYPIKSTATPNFDDLVYSKEELSDIAYCYDSNFTQWSDFYAKRLHVKDKIPNKLVTQDLPVPVRFVYADSPQTPVSDTYVIYWAYENGDDKKILNLYENSFKYNLLYPIGIGRTDKNGFLLDTLLYYWCPSGEAV